jgi:surface protein
MKQKIIVTDPYQLIAIIEKEMLKNGNQCDLNYVDVSNLKDMIGVFAGSKFNGDISEWDVSNVERMDGMFSDSSFNGNISKWNVSKVKIMYQMFQNCPFNSDISNWNVSKVRNMGAMFAHSEFNQDISNWTPYRLYMQKDIFLGCPIKIPYWAKYENMKERKIAINHHVLSLELEQSTIHNKRIKI